MVDRSPQPAGELFARADRALSEARQLREESRRLRDRARRLVADRERVQRYSQPHQESAAAFRQPGSPPRLMWWAQSCSHPAPNPSRGHGRSYAAPRYEGPAMPVSTIVLVVEDEALVQDLLEYALVAAGYEVRLLCNGAEAISFLDGCSESPRALVTDVNLGPAPNGWEIGRRARELNPVMPVVYMTGDSGDDWTLEGVADSLLVLKPLAAAQVVAAVSSLLAAA